MQNYKIFRSFSSESFSFGGFYQNEIGGIRMYLVTNQHDWVKLRNGVFPENSRIGFVPTMGALHYGHQTLIERSVAENDVTVLSIFVNPTQFNDPSDLVNYPRTLGADMELAERAGCQVVFLPSINEMYGADVTSVRADYGVLTSTLEGEHRPGHFDGMVTIVRKLLLAIAPHVAYFGEKDFQQLSIVKELVRREQLPVKIEPCKLIREASGLALSSRNVRLSDEGRKQAAVLSEVLFYIESQAHLKMPDELIQQGKEMLDREGVQTDYLTIVNAQTFEPVMAWMDAEMRALVAAYVEGVRLIDNIALPPR